MSFLGRLCGPTRLVAYVCMSSRRMSGTSWRFPQTFFELRFSLGIEWEEGKNFSSQTWPQPTACHKFCPNIEPKVAIRTGRAPISAKHPESPESAYFSQTSRISRERLFLSKVLREAFAFSFPLWERFRNPQPVQLVWKSTGSTPPIRTAVRPPVCNAVPCWLVSLWRKENAAVHLQFVAQYASNLYRSTPPICAGDTFGKIPGVGGSGKFLTVVLWGVEKKLTRFSWKRHLK